MRTSIWIAVLAGVCAIAAGTFHYMGFNLTAITAFRLSVYFAIIAFLYRMAVMYDFYNCRKPKNNRTWSGPHQKIQ